MKKPIQILVATLIFALSGAACNSTEDSGNSASIGPGNSGGTPGLTGSVPNPTIPPSSNPPGTGTYKADALIFNGDGVDKTGTASVVKILTSHGLTYVTITSAQFNAMTADEMAQYRLLIWPGGSNAEMDASITASARKNARTAVVEKGVNYIGFCAGAFIAVGTGVKSDGTPTYGLAIVGENYLNSYRPPAGMISMQQTNLPDGTVRQIILWQGPVFDWQQGILARYSDGRGAIAQAQAGKGFAILTGPHPEAPASWPVAAGLTDSDGVDHDLAWKLIDAAFRGQPLPTF